MTLEKESPCKINLLLNILGKRASGFHDLETVMHPIGLHDRLAFEPQADGIRLTCNIDNLPTDSRNLVHQAASAFLEMSGIRSGVRIHLKKNVPLAAGLGGGSGNAAVALSGLNELFGRPLAAAQLQQIAAQIGSDIPFFLQTHPALATGRGEIIQPLEFFPALRGAVVLLIHPGFGVSTAWAYSNLSRFPAALHGLPGRAQKLIALLQSPDLKPAVPEFYNALEAPVLEKYPLLALFQEFLRENGAPVSRMSGSGSSTFAILPSAAAAEELAGKFRNKFGATHWTAIVPMGPR